MTKEETTRSLSKRLQNVRTNRDADSFLQEDTAGIKPFHELLQIQLYQNHIEIKELIQRSNISRNYIYNILNGARTNPSRDHVLALCIGSGMSFSQTNQALESLKLSPLYPRDERDVRIAVCINQGTHDVTKVNLILDEHNLQPLHI